MIPRLLLACALASLGARAEEHSGKSTPTERTFQDAALWLQEAEREFQSGHPSAAIPLLERAYRSTGWQGCLLNLGMAHHALGDCPGARGYYERYLDAEPYTERRDQVLAALGELRQICASGAPAPLASEPAPRSDASAALVQPVALSVPARATVSDAAASRAPSGWDSTRRMLAVSGLGLGSATAAAAVLVLVSGAQYDREAERLDRRGRNPDNDPVARDLDRQGQRANTLALALGASSLLLLAGSASLLWLAEPERSPNLSLSVSPGESRVDFRTQF